MTFKEKSVLITGVSGGLGLGFAVEVIREGGVVYALGRNAPSELGGNKHFHFRKVDLRNVEEIPKAVEALLEGVARLDLVILNAGIKGVVASLPNTPAEVMQEVMAVNVFANKALLDSLLSGECELSQVIGISSGAAVNGSAGMGAYSLSKASLNILLRVYASENPGIHFVSIAPGLVQTRMMDQLVSVTGEASDFPAIRTMRSKLGTSEMQAPDKAARRVLDALEHVRREKSGSFLDVRNFDWGEDVTIKP